jgi:hypothetical protein
MKQKSLFFNRTSVMLIMASLLVLTGCDPSKDETKTPGEDLMVSGELTGNVTWKANNTYTLSGFVYVVDGAILTIEPGTVIKGDEDTKGTLIVEKGGKIMASGTKEKPIVFTSSKEPGTRSYGDWGGIVICGKAPVNSATGTQKIEGGPRSEFGGTIPDDNSGILRYVRIEFAGIEYSTDNEINGLTLGGVGSGTTIDHIQVSYCGDDSYEFFGGTVNAKYLVAFRGWDDEFDTDNGYSGQLQFLVGLRDPNVADKSKSNGFESDNDASGSNNQPYTSAVFSNVSLFGPYKTLDNQIEPTGGSGPFQAAMHLRRNTQLSCFNSVFAGWPNGVFIENGGKGNAQGNATDGKLVLSNNILSGMRNAFMEDAQGTPGFNESYWMRADGYNLVMEANAQLGLVDPFNLTAPKFYASSSSSAVYGKASFTNAKVAGSFFDKVSYVGAFGTDDWTAGWCNFDPQNTTY